MIGWLIPLEWIAGKVLEPFITLSLMLHRNFWSCFIAELYRTFKTLRGYRLSSVWIIFQV